MILKSVRIYEGFLENQFLRDSLEIAISAYRSKKGYLPGPGEQFLDVFQNLSFRASDRCKPNKKEIIFLINRSIFQISNRSKPIILLTCTKSLLTCTKSLILWWLPIRRILAAYYLSGFKQLPFLESSKTLPSKLPRKDVGRNFVWLQTTLNPLEF